jgi:hypothetical protein
LSNQVGIVDDELRPAFAKLLRGTGRVGKAQKLLKIALDGAAASGKPLSSISDALTKAFNGNFTTLYKLAPQLKKTKGGIEEYAESVKNAAVTSANPFDKLSVVLDNLNEQVGTALLPAFEGLANFLIDNGPAISKFLEDLFDPNSATGKKVKEFGDKLAELGDKVNDFFKRFDPEKKDGVVGFFTLAKIAADGFLFVLDRIISAMDQLTAKSGFLAVTIGSEKDKKSTITGIMKDLGFSKESIDKVNSANLSGMNRPELPVQKFEGRNTGTYNININKATMTPEQIIKEIQKYERITGRKYVTK